MRQRRQWTSAVGAAKPVSGRGLRLDSDPPEAGLLKACEKYLQYDRRVVWVQRNNTGAVLLDPGPATEGAASGSRKPARRLIRMGSVGSPDLLGVLSDGRLLGVEVKRPSGRVSPAQQAWHARVGATGAVVGVVRGLDDLRALLDSAGLGRTRPDSADDEGARA